VLEMTNENFARLLRGLTIAVGNRRNRILLYRFLCGCRIAGKLTQSTKAPEVVYSFCTTLICCLTAVAG
jgi:hypothetical protein